MKTHLGSVMLALAGALWTCSCTMLQPPLAVAPVGPEPGSQPALAPSGYLKVYTNTELVHDQSRGALQPTGYLRVYTDVECYPYDEDMYYYAHTAYGVYDSAGQRVKSVQNAASYHSLTPTRVTLPPGQYTVVGWSDAYQLVRVPVVIQAGCLTTVNLEKNNLQLFKNARPDELVRTPDGRVVGWAAPVAAVR